MFKKNPDIKHLFVVAMGFWRSSQLIADHISKNHDFSVVSSYFTNLSFAGEVFLKCLLLMRTGTLLHGHNLKELYEKQIEIDRVAIEEVYKKEVESKAVYKAMKMKNPKVDLELSSTLKEAGDAFLEWRYLYEKQPPPVRTLFSFVQVLPKYIIGIDPGLESFTTSIVPKI